MNFIENSVGRYVNYENLIFRIKSCCCKLLFLNQLYLLVGKKDLGGNIQPLLKLPVVEIDLKIVQDKEKHSKSNIYTNFS